MVTRFNVYDIIIFGGKHNDMHRFVPTSAKHAAAAMEGIIWGVV